MGEELAARKGYKSAPTDRPNPHNANPTGPSTKSAPTERPAVEAPGSPRTGGDGNTPQSVKSNVVAPNGPRLSGKHPGPQRSD